jgi:thiol-disulfide isomerase/thioredoxin
MANNLTGDFEAVFEVSTRQINGLLATLHQSGVSEDAPLPLLHSASLRIGGPTIRPPVVGDFGDWVLTYQQARGPVGLHELQTQLTANAPPGAAKVLGDLFGQLVQVQFPPPPPEPVRGRVLVQVSTLTVSLPAGSTSEVTVHASVRAHYFPDPGTTDLPQPIHGEVQATFEVRQTQSAAGKRLLIQPSAQDSKIQFITAPGTGLNAGDVDRIAAQVRKAVRDSFPLLPVDLPAGFGFSDFKGVGSGPGQAVALPIQLSGAPPPPGGAQGVNNLFTGPAGFAVAVSKEFVLSTLQPTLDGLRQVQQDFTVSVLGFLHPTYHFSVTDVQLQFNDGSIDFIVKGKATTSSWYAPNYNNIVITQRLTLALFLNTLFIPALDSDLTVSGLPDSAVDGVKLAVIAQRNQTLPGAQDALNQQLRDARTKLNDALASFDPSASAGFRAGTSEDLGSSASGAVAVTPDGVILRGDIDSGAPRYAPIIDVAETDQGQAFTALNSWIPGGAIERLVWSWVEYTSIAVWSGVTKTFTDEHRFIFPKPPAVTGASSICLRLEGTQASPQGVVASVAGGTTCLAPGLGGVLEAPSWLEPVTVPIWLPGSAGETALKDVLAGHVSVQADAPRKGELSHNFLVYFADWGADQPLEVLAEGLAQVGRKDFSLVVIGVLPAGAFDSRRREVEARLGPALERSPVRLELTEDNEGGWTRTFAVSKVPSAYLMNARREFAWSCEGGPAPDVLAKALQDHLVSAPAPRARPLRLAVAPGEPAPDVLFADDRGNHVRLRGLRGREVLLNFWQPWSAPSIKELLRLERLHKEGGGRAPFIVAFHGGKDRKALGEVRRRHGLSIVLSHDTDQRTAGLYGVRCWPTTVSVNADGLINHVQFGVFHEHSAPPKGRAAEAP